MPLKLFELLVLLLCEIPFLYFVYPNDSDDDDTRFPSEYYCVFSPLSPCCANACNANSFFLTVYSQLTFISLNFIYLSFAKKSWGNLGKGSPVGIAYFVVCSITPS